MTTAEFNASIDEAIKAVEVGIQDAMGDFPDVGAVDIEYEITVAVLSEYPAETRVAAAESLLGFVPRALD